MDVDWELYRVGALKPHARQEHTKLHLVVIPDYGDVLDLSFDNEAEFREKVEEFMFAVERKEFRGTLRMYCGEALAPPKVVGKFSW